MEIGRDHAGYHDVFCYGHMRKWYGRKFGVNSLHHQIPKSVPEGAEVMARHHVDNSIEALYYRVIKAFGVQWHPEFMDDISFLEHVIELFAADSDLTVERVELWPTY